MPITPDKDEETPVEPTHVTDTDQETIPREENVNQEESTPQEEENGDRTGNTVQEDRSPNTAIVTLPSGGGIAGIPGEHPPGKWFVDYDARTIKPYTDDTTLEQNKVPVKPAQNPELLPPFAEPNITPVAQQPQEQPQPAETHDNAASSGTAPHYDSQVAGQQKVVTERGA